MGVRGEPGAVDPAPGLEKVRSIRGSGRTMSALVERNSLAAYPSCRRLEATDQYQPLWWW
jgi:hypothetical protein